MKFLSILLTAALALLCLPGPGARAEPIAFGYTWSTSPATVTPETGDTGGIFFLDPAPASASGQFQGTATQLGLFSSAPADLPDKFPNRPYSLKLLLSDTASGQTGTL